MLDKRVAIYTLGCKTNHYESDAILGKFEKSGFKIVDFDEAADVYMVNTCTVTGEAGRKSKQMLRRAKRFQPGALVVAIGCHAQTSDLSQVADLAIGNEGKHQVLETVLTYYENVANSLQDNEASCYVNFPYRENQSKVYEDFGVVERQSETRAFVKIEDGCNCRCSYCAIPLARGRVRSRSEEQIIQEVKGLALNGFKEIVLTGIHICSYGLDRGDDECALAYLCQKLARVAGIERVRLGSLEPKSVTPKFLNILKEIPEFCEQFHLSLQSGSTAVLKRMQRHYHADMYAEVVKQIRNIWPNPSITTDLMVGFPEESDAEFLESYNFCKNIQIARMHIFRYSIREGTKAAKMRQVLPEIKKQRSDQMQALADEMSFNFHQKQCGETAEVLLEKQDPEGRWKGYTKNYAEVLLDHGIEDVSAGDIIKVIIQHFDKDFLYANPLKAAVKQLEKKII